MIKKLLLLYSLTYTGFVYAPACSPSATFANANCFCDFEQGGTCYLDITCTPSTSSQYSWMGDCNGGNSVLISGVWYQSNDCTLPCDGGAPELPQSFKFLFIALLVGLVVFVARKRMGFSVPK